MEAHIDALGSLLLDVVVGESDGECVVTQDGSGRLGMTEGS